MRRFKKLNLLAVLLSATLLTGCGTESGYTPPTAEEIAEHSAALENKDICEIPEGMTFEDICNIIYIDGKQIEMPCTVKEFSKQADGFVLTDENGTELKPEDSFMLAYFRRGEDEIRALHGPDGEIAYIITDKCEGLTINGTVGLGDNITELWELLGCEDNFELKAYANSYRHWFTDGVNAAYIKVTTDESGTMLSLSFDANEAVESIPEKTDYSAVTEEAETETETVSELKEITDWTMKELVSDISVEGIELSLPCSAEVFTENFETEEFDFEGYLGRMWGCDVYKGGKIIAKAYYDENKKEKTVNILMFDSMIFDNTAVPEFNIMGITDKSTPEDVVKILGEPNFDDGYDTDYIYYFSENKELCISFDEETKSRIEFLRIRYLNQ